jgi:polar amino acid transport system substrate-binding protein
MQLPIFEMLRASRGFAAKILAAMSFAALIAVAPAAAQTRPPAASPPPQAQPAPSAGAPVAIPGFWDPKRRPERPDLSRITVIRFLTEVDYPPFNYAGPDGSPIGFNVDLARLICEELKVQCTVQMRRFDTLITALAENRGDAVMASIAVTPDMRRLADFTDPYYRTPARFVTRRDTAMNDVRPERLEGKEIAVVAGTAHEAYLKSLFTEADLRSYPSTEQAR